MKRREFITVLGGAAAWPLDAHAQQPERVRRVGVLIAFSENDPVARASVPAFAQALRRFEWVEGKNIQLHYRFAAVTRFFSKNMRRSSSACHQMQSSRAPRRLLLHFGSGRARFRSCSFS